MPMDAGPRVRRLGWRAAAVAGVAVVAVLVAVQVSGTQTGDPVAEASPSASSAVPSPDRTATGSDRNSLVVRWTPERGVSILLADADRAASGDD